MRDSEFFYSGFIDIFFEFFIKNTVLLPYEIHTPKAILTANTRGTKRNISTVRTVLRIKYFVAFVAIDALIGLVIFFTKIHVETIL